jgi:inorganic pyrophosphatase
MRPRLSLLNCTSAIAITSGGISASRLRLYSFSSIQRRFSYEKRYLFYNSKMAFVTKTIGKADSTDFRVYLSKDGDVLSYFHDLPLYADKSKQYFNMVVEIPRGTNAKLEIATSEPMNPIRQDQKNGKLRFVAMDYLWNYGALPQTWEDPNIVCHRTGLCGDRDPIDILDISTQKKATIGEVRTVKVLGILAMKDEGETDWKVMAIDVTDPLAEKLNDVQDIEKYFPNLLSETREWFRNYKVPDGKPQNEFALNEEFKGKDFALQVISETNKYWNDLLSGTTSASGPNYSMSLMNITNPIPNQHHVTSTNSVLVDIKSKAK